MVEMAMTITKQKITPEAVVVPKKKPRFSHHEPKYSRDRVNLPIYEWKDEIVKVVSENQVTILVGETGSGKTTQIPQYVYSSGIVKKSKSIAITQPRRVAAMSVAKRVSEEYGCALGGVVGYTVRFDDTTSKETRIKFLTDGMLVREAMISPDLNQYSVIILDEAHERSLQTDILFGVVKEALLKRQDLKVIVMSATLNVDLFTSFFTGASVLHIPGRQYPVDILYTTSPQQDYLDSALVTVLQIHIEEKEGDILVFLTGQEDIETLEQLLLDYSRKLPVDALKMIVCPIFAAMPSQQQMQVFEKCPAGSRKVILATNIAETSITINGVRFVVDTGLVKQRSYIAKNGMDLLQITPISQDQCWQRSGRAGRESPGVCYRLFPEESFNNLKKTSIPEIQRVSLETVVLQLKCMGLNDVLNFEFIQKPSKEYLLKALEKLYALEALDDKGNLTPTGKRMAELPIDPMFGKMLLKSTELGCAEEVLSILSMLSVESIFYSPRDKKDKAMACHKTFQAFEGDHVTLLNVYRQYKDCSTNRQQWCYDHFINPKSMRKVEDVRKQLGDHLQQMNLTMESCGNDTDPIRRSLVCGFFLNSAIRYPSVGDTNKPGYKTTTSRDVVKIHPSSSLFMRNPAPQCIIYNELVHTTKTYLRGVTIIEPSWLIELVPKFFVSQ